MGRAGRGISREVGGSMRAGGALGLTWPRGFKTTTCHALCMTRRV